MEIVVAAIFIFLVVTWVVSDVVRHRRNFGRPVREFDDTIRMVNFEIWFEDKNGGMQDYRACVNLTDLQKKKLYEEYRSRLAGDERWTIKITDGCHYLDDIE